MSKNLGKPIHDVLVQAWFQDLIRIVPELESLLLNNVLVGINSVPVLTFTFQAGKVADETSEKLIALGYKVESC